MRERCGRPAGFSVCRTRTRLWIRIRDLLGQGRSQSGSIILPPVGENALQERPDHSGPLRDFRDARGPKISVSASLKLRACRTGVLQFPLANNLWGLFLCSRRDAPPFHRGFARLARAASSFRGWEVLHRRFLRLGNHPSEERPDLASGGKKKTLVWQDIVAIRPTETLVRTLRLV